MLCIFGGGDQAARPLRAASLRTGDGERQPATSCCSHFLRTTVIAVAVLAALAVVLGTLVMTGKVDMAVTGAALSATSAPFYLVVTGATVLGALFVGNIAYCACAARRAKQVDF